MRKLAAAAMTTVPSNEKQPISEFHFRRYHFTATNLKSEVRKSRGKRKRLKHAKSIIQLQKFRRQS